MGCNTSAPVASDQPPALDQLPPLANVKDLETMTSALPLEEFHDSRCEENEPQVAESRGIAVDSVQDEEAVDSE